MEEQDRRKRNAGRLTELDPAFRRKVERVIATLEGNRLRPRIQAAWRSEADQLKAFDSGQSKLIFGFHNITGPDGTPRALAVDMLDDDSPLASRPAYLLQLAAAAQAQGLVTGIRWKLPPRLANDIDEAIAACDWNARVKIGWDPTHVEPVGITPGLARSRILAGRSPL